MGGHDVPAGVVRRRFSAGLKNVFSIYRQRVDSWQMYDRSGLTHRLIASGRAGGTVIVEDQRSWTDLLEKSR
jgi:predicted ABC-type ATPase